MGIVGRDVNSGPNYTVPAQGHAAVPRATHQRRIGCPIRFKFRCAGGVLFNSRGCRLPAIIRLMKREHEPPWQALGCEIGRALQRLIFREAPSSPTRRTGGWSGQDLIPLITLSVLTMTNMCSRTLRRSVASRIPL